MILPRRRVLALAGAGIALAACNNAGGSAAADSDMTIGQNNAPAHLIEYASITCPHCAHFHETVWPQLKTNYIDTGKLKYTFREYPTAPAPVALAGFQLARCGGASPEQYLARVGVLFAQQRQILSSGSYEGVRTKLLQIGQEAGLSEEQVTDCIADEAGAERLRATVEAGNSEFNITGTPTLILDGRKLEDPSVLTYAGLARVIDAAIAS